MSVPYKNTGSVDCTVAPVLDNLKGKSVIVTGGSSGLGAAYVKAFLDAGAFVTNADIEPETLISDQYQYVKCDVRSWDDQLSVFKAAMEKSPGKNVDIVVANAGITGPDPVFALDEGEEPAEPDLKIININYIGTIYTVKLALHYFAKSPSSDKCLILKSSVAGYVDLVSSLCYQSSKFAVRALMCNLRRTDRCRVNVIAPWFIATPIMGEPIVTILTSALQQQNSGWALAEDSAKAVIRVAADKSINGRALAVVPRIVRKEGYMDMDRDDFPVGSHWEEWQNITLGLPRYRSK